MIDYNYSNPGFRSYWPSIFTHLVEIYHVDGFRLDCGMSGKCGSAGEYLGKNIVGAQLSIDQITQRCCCCFFFP